MDLFLPIVLLIVFCILFSICGWCCKRHKAGIVYGRAPPVTVTTQHVTTSQVAVPPYPVDPQHPIPQPVSPPPLGFGHTAPYPPGPAIYPPAQPDFLFYTAAPIGFSQPYPPPPMGMLGGTPYPPGPAAPYPPAQPAPGQLPPPYHEVVGQSGPSPSNPNVTKEGYTKQAPYNPNY